MKVTGHNEIIGDEYCFVENIRNGKIIHNRQPLSEHIAETAKANQTLKDLVSLASKEFVYKYGK